MRGVVGDPGENVRQPGLRIDAIHLARLCRASNYAERERKAFNNLAVQWLSLFWRDQVRDPSLEKFGTRPDGLGKGRMGVDGEAYVLGARAQLDRQRGLGDQVSGRRADNAAADQALGLFVEQQLGHAFVAAERQGAASIGCPTTSPMARMCGTLVRICLSTAMKPRSSTFTPAASALIKAPFGSRPTATRILSNWSSDFCLGDRLDHAAVDAHGSAIGRGGLNRT